MGACWSRMGTLENTADGTNPNTETSGASHPTTRNLA